MINTSTDPYVVLGLSHDATDSELRSRYLELVKLYPPEKDADQFRKIQAAYAAAKDPLAWADALLLPPDDDSIPSWSDVIDDHQNRPPALTPSLLLSLGNRSHKDGKKSASDKPVSASDDQDGVSTIRVDPAHD
ncbi:J domain-containing protein [Stieleria varia]|uniref:DnaJ domain protein n=1 Tax=Stieleria varia TaxID=2528005 RepID=A0A5C6AM34_9BACT|nr:J domain-containing protein [Stieleria varia]TWU01123.1 DnaJ domain protein [Stieleria varia]